MLNLEQEECKLKKPHTSELDRKKKKGKVKVKANWQVTEFLM